MTTAAKKIAQGGGTFKLYKSYSFRDKDPIIDRLRTIVKDSGESYKAIGEESGVSAHTLTNWFAGETKRPQFATVMAVARALGYDLKIDKLDAAPSATTTKRTATVLFLPRVRARRAA